MDDCEEYSRLASKPVLSSSVAWFHVNLNRFLKSHVTIDFRYAYLVLVAKLERRR
jgi:hypothetical protein